MATRKVTYTLDAETVEAIKRAAKESGKPQSWVVREAVARYAARRDKMTPAERLHKLKIFREIVKAVPPRPRAEVEAELEEIRRSRREGWRD
jgi:hypothetical protein